MYWAREFNPPYHKNVTFLSRYQGDYCFFRDNFNSDIAKTGI